MSEFTITGAVDLWAVIVNSDLNEGRGYPVTAHLCEKEATAIRLAKGASVQGANGAVAPVRLPQINGKTYRLLSHVERMTPTDEKLERELEKRRELLKQRAEALERAKALGLSDADIALLGAQEKP